MPSVALVEVLSNVIVINQDVVVRPDDNRYWKWLHRDRTLPSKVLTNKHIITISASTYRLRAHRLFALCERK
jgi:hypothetical protein